jgi:hypothetical protein
LGKATRCTATPAIAEASPAERRRMLIANDRTVAQPEAAASSPERSPATNTCAWAACSTVIACSNTVAASSTGSISALAARRCACSTIGTGAFDIPLSKHRPPTLLGFRTPYPQGI